MSPAGLVPLVELPTKNPDAILDLALGNHPELPRSALSGSNHVSHAEVSTMDPQFPGPLSLLDEALDLMQSLAITEALPPNCTQLGLGAESGEFMPHPPPT